MEVNSFEDAMMIINAELKRIISIGKESMIVGAKAAEALSKRRIFSTSGSKNSNDTNIGLYSAFTLKKRAEVGRNTGSNISLYYSGNLQDSVQIVDADNEVILEVINKTYTSSKFYPQGNSKGTIELSNEIDMRYGEVFEATQREIDESRKSMEQYINDNL